MPCGLGYLSKLVLDILNVLNNKMGRPLVSHLKNILEGLG